MNQAQQDTLQSLRNLGAHAVAQDYEAAILSADNAGEEIARLGRELAKASSSGGGLQEPEVQNRVNAATADYQRQVSELTEQLRASEERRVAAEQNAANWEQTASGLKADAEQAEAEIRASLGRNKVGQED